jgi:hypothetical protein
MVFDLRYKKEFLMNLIPLIFILIGLFQPWLWRGYKPYSEFNRELNRPEMSYSVILKTSPFFTTIIDNQIVSRVWFFNFTTTFSGLTILFSSLLPFLNINNKRFYTFTIFSTLFGFLFFFLSFGGGMGLGSVTHLSMGTKTTLLGLTLKGIFLILWIIF